MRFDDFIDVFGFHSAVPNAFGIDNNVGAKFALIQAARFVRANEFDATLFQLHFEKSLKLALACWIATWPRMARFTLIHADENVFSEFRHGSVD
jgi:hypothetical protein